MSTWQIEHTPAAGGGSATYTLAALNASSLSIQFTNWADDSAALTVRGGTAAFDAPAFAYRDKVVIWRDGARFFHGWCTGLGLAAQPAESRTYTITGPSWWLEHLPFVWPTWPAKEKLSLGERASFRWIGFALDSAIAKGAPIAKDSGNYAPFILPTPDLRASSTCLEVIQRVARLHPMSAGWWDYSGEVPVFRAALRSALPVQTVTIGTDSVETFGFTPLPDQQVESVHIAYNYTDTYGAHSVHNTAGTEPYGYGPNKLHVAIDVETYELASEAQSAGIAPLLYASLSPLAWSGVVNMHESGSPLPVIMPGSALSVAGGRAEWATMATVVQSTQWVVSAATNDTCSITLGAPEHLGPQDYLEFARAGTLAASSAGGNPGPYDPPTPPGGDDPPGTYDDLNGGIGGGAPVGSVAVQSRGGAWSLVGYAALDGTSPTRRWRRKYLAGTVLYQVRNLGPTVRLPGKNDKSCTPAVYIDSTIASSGTAAVFGGWGEYDATTGALTVGGANVETDPFTGHVTTSSGLTVVGTYGVSVDSPTQASSPTCLRFGAMPGAFSCPCSALEGAQYIYLTNEDTEDDAWARLLATDPAWSAVVTTAIRTIPVTGTTGVRRSIRYRTEHTEGTGEEAVTLPTLTGLSPWGRYRLALAIERRSVHEGGGDTSVWESAGTVYSPGWIADINGGGGIDWQEIEPEAGYETRIAGSTVEEY